MRARRGVSLSITESRAGNSDISGDKRTETQRRRQAAVQSSGLATHSFRKTRTPWNGGAKNKTVTLPPKMLEWSHRLPVLCELSLTPARLVEKPKQFTKTVVFFIPRISCSLCSCSAPHKVLLRLPRGS